MDTNEQGQAQQNGAGSPKVKKPLKIIITKSFEGGNKGGIRLQVKGGGSGFMDKLMDNILKDINDREKAKARPQANTNGPLN